MSKSKRKFELEEKLQVLGEGASLCSAEAALIYARCMMWWNLADHSPHGIALHHAV